MGVVASKAPTKAKENTPVPPSTEVKKTFTEAEIKQKFTEEAITSPENSGPKNLTRKQKNTITKADSIKLILDAEKKREEAEALLVQSSAVSLVASITQAAAVVAVVGSGPALPAVAAVAIVVGAFIALKAGHKTLIAALRLYYDKFIAAYNFIELSELVISKMQRKIGKTHDFKNEEVNLFATQFNLLLRSIAPPSVMKMIEDAKEKAERATKPKSTGYLSRINKFFSKTSGTATRVIYSGYYTDQVIKKFQEFLNACQTYQSRAFFYFLENTDEFEEVMDEVHADPRYQKIYMATNIEPEKLVEKASIKESSINPDNIKKLRATVTELQNRVQTIEAQTSRGITVVDTAVANDLAETLGETPRQATEQMNAAEKREETNAQNAAEIAKRATAVVASEGAVPATAAAGVSPPVANANAAIGTGANPSASVSTAAAAAGVPRTAAKAAVEQGKEAAAANRVEGIGATSPASDNPVQIQSATSKAPVAKEWAKTNLLLAPNNTVQMVLEKQNYQSKKISQGSKNIKPSGQTNTGNAGFNKLTGRLAAATGKNGDEGEGEGEDPGPPQIYRQVIEVGGTRRNKIRRRKQKTQRRKRQKRQSR